MDVERYHDDIKIKNYVIKEMADEYVVLQISDYICWEMLQAAVAKVTTYHCRVPMFIKIVEQNGIREE